MLAESGTCVKQMLGRRGPYEGGVGHTLGRLMEENTESPPVTVALWRIP